jgi:hypothetical protein
MGSSNQSTHSLLRSNGADRTVNTGSNPRTITITRRGGTSQGIDFDLSEVNIRVGRSYRVEITGRVTTGTSRHTLFITTNNADDGVLASTTAATDATFTLGHTMTFSQIRSLSSGRFRFGGASQQTLVITGIVITEIS